MLEEMFREDPDNIPDTWLLDDEDDTATENSQPPDVDPSLFAGMTTTSGSLC